MSEDKPEWKPRRKQDYGDFSEFEVRRLVAEYCMSVTLGYTGWGVPFKVWIELQGIATHEGHFKLKRLEPRESIESMMLRDKFEEKLESMCPECIKSEEWDVEIIKKEK